MTRQYDAVMTKRLLSVYDISSLQHPSLYWLTFGESRQLIVDFTLGTIIAWFVVEHKSRDRCRVHSVRRRRLSTW